MSLRPEAGAKMLVVPKRGSVSTLAMMSRDSIMISLSSGISFGYMRLAMFRQTMNVRGRRIHNQLWITL